MKCSKLWNFFNSIIPQDRDSQLYLISIIVLVITIILGMLGIKYFWVFGIVGLLIIIGFREYHNYEEDYESSEVDGSEILSTPYYPDLTLGPLHYPCTETSQYYGCPTDDEDVLFDFSPGVNNTGATFDEIYGNVVDQVVDSRFPNVSQSGCRQEYYVG